MVWGTKCRRQYIREYVKNELVIYIKRIVARYPTLHLISINTGVDHIHLQMEIPPNIAVSRVVQRIKQETSKLIKKRFKFIRNIYLEDGIWSVGYFSSTLGLNEEVVKKYIEYQGRRDRGRQFRLQFS